VLTTVPHTYNHQPKTIWQNNGQNRPLFFFRDSQGNEVDLLIETGAGLDAYEIKASKTISRDFFKNLDYLKKLKIPIASTHLVCGSSENRKQSNHMVQSWQDMSFTHDA